MKKNFMMGKADFIYLIPPLFKEHGYWYCVLQEKFLISGLYFIKHVYPNLATI
jgi:hypothetical protein